MTAVIITVLFFVIIANGLHYMGRLSENQDEFSSELN